ncbi:DUF3054 domain-containing protein [Citricoccus sp. I39-566]|uniref:DUF3054 domain-containing protein n=1 Tax=Citricoccus sp. I39-566 TaxID=3073268 RepID=UPI00286A1A99|nr:DUF3054 domain-containing protein [Citricoccus sp. I39-566]WMY77449.1 DUF3054 domain-containing protein [Citricoccus sp. I39-566]
MPSFPTAPAPYPTVRTAGPWIGGGLDVLLIILFAALGRRTHESGMDLGGILLTALPFLAAWAVATALTRPGRTWARIWPAGVVVWLVTVVGGLLLRVALGDTAAPSFQLVTAGVLGLFLLGRRAVTAGVLQWRRRRPRLRS